MSKDTLETYLTYAHAASAKSLQQYLDCIIVDSRPPKRLKDLLKLDEWEREVLNIIIPIIERAAGFRNDTEYSAVWITAPRGHSKTSILGIVINWLLTYAKYWVNIYAAAADERQAHILLERAQQEAQHNLWLKDKIYFKSKEALSANGRLTVLSSDAPTSSGLLGDLFIVDEITWHKDRSLFDMLYSGRNKRTTAGFIIISNAGIVNSWQHQLLESCKTDKSWYVHEVPAFSASFLDQERIKNDKRILPASFFKRVHQNLWVAAGEDNQFVTRLQCEKCCTGQRIEANKYAQHVLSIDYASTTDRTALCVMHMDKQQIILDKLDVWQGSREHHVSIERVEEWIAEQLRNFAVSHIVLDAFQLESVAQKYEKIVSLERVNFGGNTYQKISENLRSLILNQRLVIYPQAGQLVLPNGKLEDLIDELEALIIIEKGNIGWRFEHLDGFHDDRGVVVGMCSLKLHQLAMKQQARIVIFDTEMTDSTKIDPNEVISPYCDKPIWDAGNKWDEVIFNDRY